MLFKTTKDEARRSPSQMAGWEEKSLPGKNKPCSLYRATSCWPARFISTDHDLYDGGAASSETSKGEYYLPPLRNFDVLGGSFSVSKRRAARTSV